MLTPSPLKEDGGLPRIMIHASSGIDLIMIKALDVLHREGSYPKKPYPTDYQRSAIIGSVRLLGVVNGTDLVSKALETDQNLWNSGPIAVACKAYQELRKSVSGRTKPADIEFGEGFIDISDYQEIFWWLVDRPILLKTPVSCKGHLNLWTYDKLSKV